MNLVLDHEFAPRWALPIFLTRKSKALVGIIGTILAAILYLGTNHYTLFPPQMLPMWRIDEWVPFIPQTIFIYLSEYPLFAAVYLLSKDEVNANKYLYSFLFLQMISVIIFIIYPTTYPRDRFPLPSDLDAVTHFFFSTLRSADTPNSCLPSLHVSSCYLSSFVFLDEQREKFPLFFAWATAIGISTLTTKQHYLIDVIAGLGMAMLVYWICHRLIPFKDVRAFRA